MMEEGSAIIDFPDFQDFDVIQRLIQLLHSLRKPPSWVPSGHLASGVLSSRAGAGLGEDFPTVAFITKE